MTRSWVMSSMRQVLAPEQERLAGPALVDHLLVELADPGAVGQEHAEEPAVGDGAAAGDGQALRPGPAADRAVRRGPTRCGAAARRTPRTGSGRTSRSSTLAQHLVGQLGEGRGAAAPARPARRPTTRRARTWRRSAGPARRAGCGGSCVSSMSPSCMRCDDHGRLDQVVAVLREELAPARLAHLVAGPADALQAARHRAGRLDLDDEVDGAHVDAELERAGGDQALEAPRLSSSSICRRRSRDSEPWWALTSSWPGSGGRPSASAARFSPSRASSLSRVASRSARRRALTKMSVERCSSTSSSSRGGWPARCCVRTGPAAAGPLTGSSMISPRAPMSSTGTTTSISSGLRTPASTMVTGRGRDGSTVGRRPEAAEEAGDLVERALRGRQPDALGRALAERPRAARGVSDRCDAPLGGGQRVDLVDDHGLDVDAASRAPPT